MTKEVNYHRALVTYIDILGFRDLVNDQKAGVITRTIRLVRQAIEPDSATAKRHRLTFQTFSDLTVVSIPLSRSEQEDSFANKGLFVFQMMRLIHAQSRQIVRSWGQLFGPGLIEAYDLERVRARFPRIVVNANVFIELRLNPNLWMHDYLDEKRTIHSLLSKEFDGVYFLDYLRAMNGEFDEPDYYLDFLLRHRDLIRRGLRRFPQVSTAREKYEWLSNYHNATVTKLFGKREEKYLV